MCVARVKCAASHCVACLLFHQHEVFSLASVVCSTHTQCLGHGYFVTLIALGHSWSPTHWQYLVASCHGTHLHVPLSITRLCVGKHLKHPGTDTSQLLRTTQRSTFLLRSPPTLRQMDRRSLQTPCATCESALTTTTTTTTTTITITSEL